MQRQLVVLVGALLCATVTVAPAHAQAQLSKDEKAQARKHWDRATKLYDLGRYDEAIKEFEASYEISGAPSLLFNIAQSYRLKGDCAGALPFYRRYLAKSPDAENRADAEAKAAEMQACVDKANAPPPVEKPAPPPVETRPAPPRVEPEVRPLPAPPPARPGRTEKLVGLGVGGVGLVAVGLGVYFAVDAGDKANQLDQRFAEGSEWDAAAARLEADGQAAGDKAVIFTSVGAAALVGGAVLYWLGARQDAQVADPGVALGPVRGGWQLVWSCAF